MSYGFNLLPGTIIYYMPDETVIRREIGDHPNKKDFYYYVYRNTVYRPCDGFWASDNARKYWKANL